MDLANASKFDGFGSDAEMATAMDGLLADGWQVTYVRDDDTGVYAVTIARTGLSFTGEAESFLAGFEAAYGEYDGWINPVKTYPADVSEALG